jgi:hypothetical protein
MTPEPQYGSSTQFDGVASVLLNNPDDATEVAAALAELIPNALSIAVGNAKAGLSSTLISWALADLSGQVGGFTHICEVKATISAKAGPP